MLETHFFETENIKKPKGAFYSEIIFSQEKSQCQKETKVSYSSVSSSLANREKP